MTLDDLMKIAIQARIEKVQSQISAGIKTTISHALEERDRAGIRAVVAALRDEIGRCLERDAIWPAMRTLVDCCDDILGDAVNEKAAGAVAQEVEPRLREVTGASPVRLAADPSPEVCEWMDDAYIGCFTTSCSDDAAWNRLGGTPKDEGYNFCPSCGKPISFREK